VRFFFDNCLSPYLAEAIAALEKAEDKPAEVVHLQAKFEADTDDVDWLPVLAAEKNWIVVTGDLDIRRRVHERQVWRDSNLVTFFMAAGWTDMKKWDQAWKFMKRWPGIREQALRARPGQAWRVPVGTGRLEPVA